LAITTITWIGWKDQKKQTELFVDWCGEAASYNELKKDFWDTLNGKPTALPPKKQ